MDLLGRLAAGVCGGAGLALAGNRLHVVILVGFRRHVRVAVSQRRHRGNPSGEGAHRMMGPLEGELPIRYFVRIAASPAGAHADQVPATAALLVRLRYPIRVFASVAAQLLRVVRVISGGRGSNYGHADHKQEERRGSRTPGKSVVE